MHFIFYHISSVNLFFLLPVIFFNLPNTPPLLLAVSLVKSKSSISFKSLFCAWLKLSNNFTSSSSTSYGKSSSNSTFLKIFSLFTFFGILTTFLASAFSSSSTFDFAATTFASVKSISLYLSPKISNSSSVSSSLSKPNFIEVTLFEENVVFSSSSSSSTSSSSSEKSIAAKISFLF